MDCKAEKTLSWDRLYGGYHFRFTCFWFSLRKIKIQNWFLKREENRIIQWASSRSSVQNQLQPICVVEPKFKPSSLHYPYSSWYKLTCLSVPFKVISVKIFYEVSWSCFFGSVVQLADVLSKDVVKTMAPEIGVTRLKTINWACNACFLKNKAFQHHPKDRFLAFRTLFSKFPHSHVTQHKGSYDADRPCHYHFVERSTPDSVGLNRNVEVAESVFKLITWFSAVTQ